jgi:hypothetical protein
VDAAALSEKPFIMRRFALSGNYRRSELQIISSLSDGSSFRELSEVMHSHQQAELRPPFTPASSTGSGRFDRLRDDLELLSGDSAEETRSYRVANNCAEHPWNGVYQTEGEDKGSCSLKTNLSVCSWWGLVGDWCT